MANPRGYSQTAIELINAELAKRGIGPVGSTGAIAGVMGESGANLDPAAFNSKDPGGGSGGIGQWNRGRLVGPSGMLAFARNAGVPVDVNNPLDAKKVPLSVQAQYLGHELDTTYAGVRNQLQAAQSPQQALNIWVNSFEDPLDKAGAIRQRSQYLAPVGAALSGMPAQPASVAAVPGTTINTTAAAGGGAGPLPGFTGQKASDQFTKGIETLDKAMGGSGQAPDGQGGGQRAKIEPSPMIPAPGARGVGPGGGQLLDMPQVYGQTINSLADPQSWAAAHPGVQWGATPPGASPIPSMQPGQAPQLGSAAPIGAGLNAMQQLQMLAMQQQDPFGGYGYG